MILRDTVPLEEFHYKQLWNFGRAEVSISYIVFPIKSVVFLCHILMFVIYFDLKLAFIENYF